MYDEVTTIVLLYTLLLFTDFVPYAVTRHNIGYFYISICGLNMVVHLTIMVVLSVKGCIFWRKKKWYWRAVGIYKEKVKTKREANKEKKRLRKEKGQLRKENIRLRKEKGRRKGEKRENYRLEIAAMAR